MSLLVIFSFASEEQNQHLSCSLYTLETTVLLKQEKCRFFIWGFFFFLPIDFLVFNRIGPAEVDCAITAVVGGSTVNKASESSTQFLGLSPVPSRYFEKSGTYGGTQVLLW